MTPSFGEWELRTGVFARKRARFPLSGLPFTEIVVLERSRDGGALEVIVRRRTVVTIVRAVDDERGIVFLDQDGEPLLIVPWNGVQVPFNPAPRAPR